MFAPDRVMLVLKVVGTYKMFRKKNSKLRVLNVAKMLKFKILDHRESYIFILCQFWQKITRNDKSCESIFITEKVVGRKSRGY